MSDKTPAEWCSDPTRCFYLGLAMGLFPAVLLVLTMVLLVVTR